MNNASVGSRERHGLDVTVIDFLIAVAVGLVDVCGTYLVSRHHPSNGARPWDVGALALLSVGPIAVLFRRRFPVPVLAVVFASTFVYSVIGYPNGPHWLALIVAFFTAVLTGHRRAGEGSIIAGYLAFSWGRPLLHRGGGPSFAAAFGLLAWLLVLMGAAEVVRIRSERGADRSRMHEEAARRRASEERLQIARDVHDVVAHNMSLINVQAAAALHSFDQHPERAREALATIKGVSKEALVELRSVLGVLRRVDEEAPLSPTPGVDHLGDLVARSATAGLAVELTTEGEERRLAPAVDTAVYRIVQEALTNVTRHAVTAEAAVRIEYGERDLVVEIDDRGSARLTTPRGATGNGIAGMTERAALLGGTLQAGPRSDGGFRVRLWFPLKGVE